MHTVLCMNNPSFKTKHAVEATWGWCNKPFTIPKGSKVVPAINLPDGSGYWLKNIPKAMRGNWEFKAWHETYGFLIEEEDVKRA